MTEKQTSSEDKKFNGLTLGAAAAIIGVGATLSVGSVLHNEERKNDIKELAEKSQEASEAYHDSIVEAVNAKYDTDALVGQIAIKQGTFLGDASISLVSEALGPDVYEEVKGRIYDPLIDSARLFNPQPGETYSVVEVDLNPTENDGNEYIVVASDHVVHSNVSEIPSPIIKSNS